MINEDMMVPPKRFSDQVRLLWIVNNCNILAELIPIVLYIESEHEGCPVLKRDSTSWHFFYDSCCQGMATVQSSHIILKTHEFGEGSLSHLSQNLAHTPSCCFRSTGAKHHCQGSWPSDSGSTTTFQPWIPTCDPTGLCLSNATPRTRAPKWPT